MKKITLTLTLFIAMIFAGCAEKNNNNNKIENNVTSKKGKIQNQEYLKQNRNSSKAIKIDNEVKRTDDYIIPTSSTQLITNEILDKLDKNQLDLARNEIYARHGYIFTIKEYKEYFSVKTWYKEDINFSEAKFNEIEKKNLKKINNYVEALNEQIKVPNNFGDYDLNSDGDLEKVMLIFKDNSTKFSLTVDNSTLEQNGNNFKNTMFIYDISPTDKRLEIAIVDEKGTDNYETYFYQYNGDKISCVGKISSGDNTMKVTGNGKVLVKENCKLLNNLLCDVVYQLTNTQGFVRDELGSSCKINVKLKLKEDLPLLLSKLGDQKTFIVPKDEEVVINSADDVEWIAVTDSTGKEGFLKITEPNKIYGKNFNDVFLDIK